jgi:hypothetical protein
MSPPVLLRSTQAHTNTSRQLAHAPAHAQSMVSASNVSPTSHGFTEMVSGVLRSFSSLPNRLGPYTVTSSV